MIVTGVDCSSYTGRQAMNNHFSAPSPKPLAAKDLHKRS